jgi:hypothetical protein
MPRTGLSNISPSQRPAQCPRDYQAMLDRLRVRDYVASRMTVSEIARRMRKDKAWVSRAIRTLREESQCFADSPEGQATIQENIRRFESLVANALGEVERASSVAERVAAIRVAGNLVRQKGEYEMVTGRAPKPLTFDEERQKWTDEHPWEIFRRPAL